MFTSEIKVLIKGAGEMASGIAHRLFRSGFKVCMTEIPKPIAVRRTVSFSESVYEIEAEVEGIKGQLVSSAASVLRAWGQRVIPVMVDPEAKIREKVPFNVLIDAILAKKNLRTAISDASLVVGIGPGFEVGKDVHMVIESNRGHNLGRVILYGKAEENTGIPGSIGLYSTERILRASQNGLFKTAGRQIGDYVTAQEVVGYLNDRPVIAAISGVLRGLLRDGMEVMKGTKLGDIDPRGISDYCFTISDKARAIAGGVLEGIMLYFEDTHFDEPALTSPRSKAYRRKRWDN
jgi:xanthine dehydrogenase accessory factor